MKKLNYLLMGLFVASAFTFTSCTKEGEEGDIPLVDIQYALGDNAIAPLTTAEITGAVGTSVNFNVIFTKGYEKLAIVEVISNIGDKPYTILNEDLTAGIFSTAKNEYEYEYKTTVAELEERITFRVTDKAGLVGEATVTVKPTTESVTVKGDLKTSVHQIMGAVSNANGSLYSLMLDKVIKLSSPDISKEIIDLVYLYNDANKATLASPSDGLSTSTYPKTIGLWSSPNVTKFAICTAADYDNTTNTATFNENYPTDSDFGITHLDNLSVSTIHTFAIFTQSKQKALVRVKNVTPGTSGSITIEVKTVK